jgi:hypothetical protein
MIRFGQCWEGARVNTHITIFTLAITRRKNEKKKVTIEWLHVNVFAKVHVNIYVLYTFND